MTEMTNILRIEYTILGSVLYEPDHAGEVVAALTPEDFTWVATRGLFEAISALHFRGAPIAPVTVIQEAGSDYEIAVKDALPYALPPNHLDYYCGLLREARKLRQIKEEAVTISAAESLQDVSEVMDRLNGLMVTRKSVEILSASQAALDFYNRQESAEKPEYLTWGFKKLNDCLYAELGDFIVVGGYPSAGKTLLSIQFAVELADKYRVGYFSLETSPRKLIDRMMSHLSHVPLSKLKRRDLNEADWAALAEASSKLASLQLDCIDAGGMSVRDVQAVSLNKRYQVVIVDYLQLMPDGAKSRYDQVTNISQGLHTMARANNIAVIALAQLSRPEKVNGKAQPPTMSSFRESGQIEQDADVALLLWPSDLNDNKSHRVLKIGKNKEGERLKMELDFDGAIQTFTVREDDAGKEVAKKYSSLGRAAKRTKSAAEQQQMSFVELPDNPNYKLPF